MALDKRSTIFLTILEPLWEGPGRDQVIDREKDLRLGIGEEYVTFIHEGARPTDPYFMKIKIEDIKELAELLEKKTF